MRSHLLVRPGNIVFCRIVGVGELALGWVYAGLVTMGTGTPMVGVFVCIGCGLVQ